MYFMTAGCELMMTSDWRSWLILTSTSRRELYRENTRFIILYVSVLSCLVFTVSSQHIAYWHISQSYWFHSSQPLLFNSYRRANAVLQIQRAHTRINSHRHINACVLNSCVWFVLAHNQRKPQLLKPVLWMSGLTCWYRFSLRDVREKDRKVSGNNGRKRHLSLCWTEGIFYELRARHISMTPCCLLYALPIYLGSLDSVLWLYSCKGRSFNHRPSIQSTQISTFINRVGWFLLFAAAFEVIGSLLMLLTVLCSFVALNSFPSHFISSNEKQRVS